jgi:WD40 repeat protein
VLPDDKGLGLLDLLSGSPLRVLERPDRLIVGVLGEPTGRRLVTVELVADSSAQQRFGTGQNRRDVPFLFQVVLWDADNLSQPIATLDWRVGPEVTVRRGDAFPLVAISPDGKTVAVAAHRGMLVKLYSARDGTPLKETIRFGPGQPREASANDLEIEPQAELTALALGPHNSLAIAGNTPGGVAIRIWNLDSPSSQTSLNPPAQSITRMMRFSPRGNLLAIAGSGPIELWDPVALNLVAVLGMSDQAIDLAFAPDGRTLAAVSRAGAATLWAIHDSAARTQLRGFDSRPMTLAFSDDGLLAGAGWEGEVWSWRSGHCPQLGPPAPISAGSTSVTSTVAFDSKHSEPPGADGPRSKARPRGGEGPRPPTRGFPPQSLVFDDSRRMVLHELSGLRVYKSSANPADNPSASRIFAPPPSGFGFFGTARTPDGKFIALLRSGNIFLWNAEAPSELVPVAMPSRPAGEPARNSGRRQSQGSRESPGLIIASIQIAPLGRELYTLELVPGSSSMLRVWELEATASAKSIRAREIGSAVLEDAMAGPRGAINFLLSGDGRLIAVPDRSGQVTLLNASTLAVLGPLTSPGKEPESLWPPAMAFSSDGAELAVGSERGAISLWSVSKPALPQLRLQLPGHRSRVNCLAYDPHARRLASATSDSIVEVWDLDIIDRELIRLKLAD